MSKNNKPNKLSKMKALVQAGSPRKGYEELLIGTPTVDEFDRSDQQRHKGGNSTSSEFVRAPGQNAVPQEMTLNKPDKAIPSLDAKINQSPSVVVIDLLIDEIIPDPSQPRTVFDPTALDELRESIKERGLQQPILVRRLSPEEVERPSIGSNERAKFMLIAGERRWRAVKALGHPTIAAIIRENTSHLNNFLSALTENIQRESLHPIDEARAYKRILELESNGEKSVKNQSQLASLLGVNRRRVSEKLQLLDLPSEALKVLFGNPSQQVQGSHALELMRLTDKDQIVPLCKRIVEEQLSFREIRAHVNALNLKSSLNPDRSKSSFRPIRKKDLGKDGQKGFDLVIKYRSDRREDRDIIINTLRETLNALERPS